MTLLEYQLWDVFTAVPYAGNQLAVIPHADDLDTAMMQRIANEFALPETVFVVSPQDHACGFALRIFTPRRELPMAGHPTIGALFALAASRAIEPGTAAVTVELGVGPTTVDLNWRGDVLDMAWMAQANPVFGPHCADADVLGRVLGLPSSDLVAPDAPAQVVSSGVPLLFIGVRSRAAVDTASLNRQALRELVAGLGIEESPVYVFTLEGGDDDALTYSRMFAPAFGIEEDPATGGAGGPLLGYLAKYHPHVVAGPGPFVNRQGVHMGRPATIYLAGTPTADGVRALRIGGRAVGVGEGRLYGTGGRLRRGRSE